MPLISLPDGSSRQFDQAVTVGDIAADIGPGLAKAALAGKVDGQLVDTSFLVQHDAEVAIITTKSDEALELIRHDAAHVMAQAVQELFPGTQVTIGPAIDPGQPGSIQQTPVGSWLCGGDQYPPSLTALSIA